MGRAPCCDKANVKKGPWSPEEDTKLKEYIEKHGTGGNWIALPQKAGLRRCGKSCRLRWLNYLRPNIKHGEFSDDEDRIICTLFASIGSRWSIIAAQLPGRTDNDIKNYWNTKLKKKLMNLISSTTPNNRQIRKQPLHHLESFNASSTCCYPSPSVFHNSNININAPSSSSSSSSTPSSYLYSTTTTTSSYHDQTFSIPSSPSAAAAASAAVVTTDHGYINVVPTTQDYTQVVKDSSTLLVFGSGADQASCSSNSDGSCHYDYGGVGVYEHNNNNTGNLQNGLGGNCEKANGYYGDTSLDSSLEEFKQLISTTNLCSSGLSNNVNFFVDEIKADEKVMYY